MNSFLGKRSILFSSPYTDKQDIGGLSDMNSFKRRINKIVRVNI